MTTPSHSQASPSAGTQQTIPVVRIGEKHYGWVEQISSATVELKKLRDRIARGITLLAVLVAVALLARLVIEVVFLQAVTGIVPLASWFLLVACFCLYRFRSRAHHESGMPRISSSDQPEMVQLARGEGVHNIAEFFTQDANKAVEDAYGLAHQYGHGEVGALHLFAACLGQQQAAVLFDRLGIDFDLLKDPLVRRLERLLLGKPTRISQEAQQVLAQAFLQALKQGRREVSSLEIFSSVYGMDPFVRELFYGLKVADEQVHNTIEWIRITEKLVERYHAYRKAAVFKPTGPMNRSMSSLATPMLDAVSEDLTAAAVKGQLPLLVGRDRELEQLFRIIEGGRQSVVLVGPQGAGKSAMLAGVAERMVEERVPEVLRDKRLVSISIPHVLAGANEAQAQERLLEALNDAVRSGNVILALENLEQLSQAPAELLSEYLSRSATFAIATTTAQAYARQVEQSVLGGVFEKVLVGEPEVNEAIHVLESKIGGMEYEFHVVFSYDAVEKAVKLTDRYLHEEYLPKKAIEAAREAALRVSKTRGQGARVSGEDIAQIVSEKSGVPLTAVSLDESALLLHIEDRLRSRVIGQEEAVKAVSAALRRGRAGMRSQGRPVATFLFLGPTGVGKTELAKAVAAEFFGNKEAMQRFDMSEYQDPSSIHRLIGVPGGREGGLLTEAVRHHPFSILLFDEFEKAHPEILNLFLQVFDDGRLTDAAGRTVDFSSAVIVATSNAGASFIQDAVTRNIPIGQIKTQLLEQELRGVYRPELLNRFDGIIVFKPLSLEEVEQIASLMIGQVAERLDQKGVHLRLEEGVLGELARAGFDPKFGARPLRRVIQDRVEDAIASALLEGSVLRRDTIVVQAGGGITIERALVL